MLVARVAFDRQPDCSSKAARNFLDFESDDAGQSSGSPNCLNDGAARPSAVVQLSLEAARQGLRWRGDSRRAAVSIDSSS